MSSTLRNRKYSLAAKIATTLLLMTGGWEFSKANASEEKKAPAAIEFKEVSIVVQDQNGQPVEGATLQPYGLRVKGPRRLDGYGWSTNLYGARPLVTTDKNGMALVKYPVVAFPDEKLFTGQIHVLIDHPSFAPGKGEANVDQPNSPFHITNGITLEVAGYFGTNREPVKDIIPIIGGDPTPKTNDWQKEENGVLAYNRLAPGGHIVQLMGKLPSGELVYSEAVPFIADPRASAHFTLEMKPGIRLEGQLDRFLLRPVKNGRVVISVRPKEFPAPIAVPEDFGALQEKYGEFHFWMSYRPIAEDGTFVFESIPPGEVDVIVHGDGFISTKGAQMFNRSPFDAKLVGSQFSCGVPQQFPLTAAVTSIEVVTEATATLEVSLKNKSGDPIPGISIHVNPNVVRIRSGLFGMVPAVCDEELLRAIPRVPQLNYTAVADKDGIAVLRNVPAFTTSLTIWSDEFELPLPGDGGADNRDKYFHLSPGKTEKLSLTLQRKGTQFIGDVK